MYIIKNAWKSITRNKGRNIMIMLIALVIAVAACISLSIREAAQTTRSDTLNRMSVTAQLSYDRTSVMQTVNSNKSQDTNDGFEYKNFDFSALQGVSLSLEDYLEYADLLSPDDGYYYTLSSSMNAGADLLPYGADEADEATEGELTEMSENRFAGKNGMLQTSYADFNITGYSSYDAMMSLFGEDGTCTISRGSIFDETSPEPECIVSEELAICNDINVGDTVTLCNPDNAEETYELTVVGIYTNSAADTVNNRFSFSDPANNIYMSSTSLNEIAEASLAAGNTTAASDGSQTDTAITVTTSFTYVLANTENFEAFQTAAENKGLPENYTITSSDLAAYENSLTPLNTLGTMTSWFFLIVLIIGCVILVVINVFNLRERKYEVGVLTAIGMKKSKVAVQFICELFIITFTAIVIGSVLGASVSVPVTNTLLEQQIEKTEASDEQLNNNFGMPDGNFGNRGNKNHGTTAKSVDYITSVSSATNLTVILQMATVGLFLTLVSGMAAMAAIMRYEPLRILSDRS